jgi:hypothetical protein
MLKLVEYYLENGASFWIEVDEIEPSGYEECGPERAKIKKLKDIILMITPSTEFILDKFADMKPLPKEVELEFGIKLNTQVGAVIASTSGEANYKIRLKWDREDINEQRKSK